MGGTKWLGYEMTVIPRQFIAMVQNISVSNLSTFQYITRL